jgi:ribosomal protein S20
MIIVAAYMKKEDGYYLVGASGHNYGSTKKLQVKNYHKAMASVDKKEWEKAIKMEYEKMQKYNVFKVIHRNEVQKVQSSLISLGL